MAMSSTSNSPRVSSAAASPSRRWRDLAILLVLLALVVAGLVGLALATGWEETVEAIQSLTWGQLGILLILSLINYVFRGVRWHHIFCVCVLLFLWCVLRVVGCR